MKKIFSAILFLALFLPLPDVFAEKKDSNDEGKEQQNNYKKEEIIYKLVTESYGIDTHDILSVKNKKNDHIPCIYNPNTKIFSIKKELDYKLIEEGYERRYCVKISKQSSITITGFIKRVIEIGIRVIGTFAVLALVVGAYMWLTSGGEESQIEKGKTIIIYSALGIIVAFLSNILVGFLLAAPL